MSVNTLYKDTTCIHNVSTLHFILYKLPTPQRSVTEMVGKQTSQPDGNKLLLGCHDCLPRTKYKESSNMKVGSYRSSLDALPIDNSIRHTFCGTMLLSWLFTDKNGALFIKQNSCRLFYRVGKSLRTSFISWNLKKFYIKGGELWSVASGKTKYPNKVSGNSKYKSSKRKPW